jgi:secreted trypsin-like serine protease
MFSRRAVVFLVTLLALLVATPAQAITFGTPDDNAHPNVGAVIAIYTPISEDPIIWCSGTLVAPKLFLTAAHCVEEDPGLTIIGVSFDPEPLAHPDSVITDNVLHSHPGYPGPASDPLDIAIIEFKSPVNIKRAELPTLHQFDSLAQKNGLHGQQFTAVGYGVTERQHEPGQGSPDFDDLETRMFAFSTFRALTTSWLRLSQNPSTGDAGTCYGDSGGPNFLGAGGEPGVIAAITITGDTPCRATNVDYRLDSLSAQSFLADFGLVARPTATTGENKADTGQSKKADKGKANKASKDRGGKKHRSHRR